MTPESTPQRVLILFAHPAFERSRVQLHLRDAALEVEGVSFHDLYAAYPDLDIDVEKEQELLASHDLIVLQHPFYWYSTPSILKEWQDLVLTHGWAFGSEGTALQGKVALSAISAGGGAGVYEAEGRYHYTMRELLAPIAQTFELCGVRYLGPFTVHGTHAITPERIVEEAARWRELLEAFVAGRVDLDAASSLPNLNTELSALVRQEA